MMAKLLVFLAVVLAVVGAGVEGGEENIATPHRRTPESDDTVEIDTYDRNDVTGRLLPDIDTTGEENQMDDQYDAMERSARNILNENDTPDVAETEGNKNRTKRQSFSNSLGRGIFLSGRYVHGRRLPTYGWQIVFDRPVGPVNPAPIQPPPLRPDIDNAPCPAGVIIHKIGGQSLTTLGSGSGSGSDMESRDVDKRIINGKVATPGDHPYICSLQIQRSGTWFHICGSVIYNQNTVITAAHCVSGFNMADLRIVCGEFNLVALDNTEQYRTVTQVKIYPYYSTNGDKGFANDLALLKLSSPLRFNADVKAGVIYTGLYSISTSCVLVGWGKTATGYPDQLNDVAIQRLSYSTCYNLWGYGRTISSHVCYKDQNTLDAPCDGDGGGPSVCGGIIDGVWSWGVKDCRTQYYPSIYTRLSTYRYWIPNNAF